MTAHRGAGPEARAVNGVRSLWHTRALSPVPSRAPTRASAALGLGLLCSGMAGIVNQVVWQRGLKVFLGGSETWSSMTVVLVFLLGLGAGSALAAGWAARSKNPMRALAGLELGLVLINALVAVLLALDLTGTVYAVQRVAVAAGVPLRVLYAVGAALVLLPPTLLMGATMPVASEAVQRQLGATDRRLVPALFFINTLGAAGGALAASLWLLPWHGQAAALSGAVVLNLIAALTIGLLGRCPTVSGVPGGVLDVPGDVLGGRYLPFYFWDKSKKVNTVPFRLEEWLGFALGFLSLGYEMLLLRALTLSHGPLPSTFAAGLCAFLVAWSLGVAVASRYRRGLFAPALITALLTAALPAALPWGKPLGGLSIYLGAAFMALPVLGFGLMYGVLVSRRAESWGHDVGRYAALNTVGSCLGVLFFTMAGYEAPLGLAAGAIGLGLAGVGLLELWGGRTDLDPRRWTRVTAGACALGAVAALIYGWSLPHTDRADSRVYWGRDGVVAIQRDGDLFIDGLWHSRLTVGEGHVGRPYTWTMAAAAALAHPSPSPRRALVVGAGVGVSGVTLAGIQGLEVDGYEINRTLRRVLQALPDMTLGALHHKSLRWIWQDARTGLALDETSYDIILSAPLHLRQAGSSQLLSQEYLRLVKSRLNPGGVLAVYSHEGNAAQALLVQRTLADAFRHRTTWMDGMITVASDRPIRMDRALLRERMKRQDTLYRQMRTLDQSLRDGGEDGLFAMWDGPDSGKGEVANLPITDDWPLLEYPAVARALVTPVKPAR